MDRHADHIVPTVGQPFAGSRHQEVSVWRGRRLGECDVLPSCQPLRLHFNAHRALPNKETKNASAAGCHDLYVYDIYMLGVNRLGGAVTKTAQTRDVRSR